MAELNIYTTTFNGGRSLIDTNFFAANFFNALKTNVPPDLVVLCLEEVAPIGYAFLGGSLLTPYFSRFDTALQLAASQRFGNETAYETLVVRNVGLTAIMLFIRRSARLVDKITGIETAGVGCGFCAMGNKGGVGVRLGLGLDSAEGMALTFVAAHLAPMEDQCERRNEDWKTICEGLVFESGDSAAKRRTSGEEETEPLLSSSKSVEDVGFHGLFSPKTHIYFAGDLNYRTSDTSPKPEDYKNWPQPVESVDDARHYGHLLAKDQLAREQAQNKTLHNLSEAPISFPPTYKYSDAAQKHAASLPVSKSSDDEDQVWLWAKHRTPSWCDRILYLTSAPPLVHSYTALPVQPTSDHRPVALSFSILLEPLPKALIADVKQPYPIRKDWREARAAARRYEILVGLASYLALTWEGEALLAGTVIGVLGGYFVLRTLLAGS